MQTVFVFFVRVKNGPVTDVCLSGFNSVNYCASMRENLSSNKAIRNECMAEIRLLSYRNVLFCNLYLQVQLLYITKRSAKVLIIVPGCAGLWVPSKLSGADPGFLKRGFICITVCVCVWGGGGVALPILSHFS